MKKSTPKDIIKKVKAKEAAEVKANYTFRLTIQLMEDFKKRCEKNQVSMASVLEEMLHNFTQD